MVIIFGSQSLAHVRSFPDAEGWAAVTGGGRGGQVLKVSNLNPDGPGSLRAALETEGPRMVIFDVGGVIDLQGSSLLLVEPFITIVGQSTPYPGVTLIDGDLEIRDTHDVIIQHIRIRPGAVRHAETPNTWNPGGVSVYNSHNVIVDHCSFSWTVSEALVVTGPRFDGEDADSWRENTSHRVTFSNNIVAETLSLEAREEESSRGLLVDDNTSDIAIIKNFFGNNDSRNPLFKAGVRGVILNNVIYNPGSAAMHYSSVLDEWTEALAAVGTPPQARISVVGNRLHWGPANQSEAPIPLLVATDEFASLPDVGESVFLELFLEDNLRFDETGTLDPEIAEVTNPLGEPAPQYLVESKQVWHTSLRPQAADELDTYILSNVGAWPWKRDAVDERILMDWQNRTGSIVNLETDVGGFPILPSTARSENWDTDNDGMPNAWELLKGLDPDTPDDDGFDLDPFFDPLDGTGYTNLELYLQEVERRDTLSEIQLEAAVEDGNPVLIWKTAPPGGRLEYSNDLSNWEWLAESSVSGKQFLSLEDGSKRMFVRWSPIDL